MEPKEMMISFQDSQPVEVEKKKNATLKAPRFKRSVARQWVAAEKTENNSDTASTASTENSESYDYDDEISEVSYQETCFEALDLSTTPTAPTESYWDKIVQSRLAVYGMRNRRTAEAYFNKGRAYMVIHDYDTAYSDFSISASILLWIHGPDHLGVARSYQHLGLAAYRSDKLSIAKSALESAFKIRHDILGPLHIDTVDTCSRIGSVHYKQQDFPNALGCYQQVMTATRAIFGKEHVAVAETAQALAKIYARMGQKKRAAKIYKFALKRFIMLGLETRMAQVEKVLCKLGVEDEKRAEI